MWFLFGLVTLVLAIVAALRLRRRSAWRGTVDMLEVDGERRHFEHGEEKHKNTVVSRLWGVTLPGDFDFRLHAEGWFDALCRRLGVNAERSVGDEAFDRAIFIESDDERLVSVLRGEPALRARMLRLQRELRLGGFMDSAWHAAGGRLWLEAVGKVEAAPALVAEVVGTLHALAQALHARGGTARAGDPFVARAVMVLALNAGFIALAVAALLRVGGGNTDVLEPWPMFWALLPIGLALAAVHCVVAARWLRNSARAHRVLAEVLVLGVPAIVIGCYGLAREANMALDGSPPAWRVVEVASTTERTYRCGRRNRRTCHEYRLHLPDGVGDDGGPRVLAIDREQFARLPRQGAVALDVRPGAFGFAWVAGVRPG